MKQDMPTQSAIAQSRSLSRVQELLQTGLATEAALLCESILGDLPTDAAALRLMGECCLALGDVKGAWHYTDCALRSEPNDPETLNNAAVLCFQDRQYETAMNLLHKALSLRPDYADAHQNLAAVYGRVTLADTKAAIKTHQLLRTLQWFSANCADDERAEIVVENRRLRQTLLAEHHNRFGASKQRILLYSPSLKMGALYYIFESWQQCLEYLGVPAKLVTTDDDLKVLLEAFCPTTLISVATEAVVTAPFDRVLSEYSRTKSLRLGLCSEFRGKERDADFRITFHLDPSRDEVLARQTTPLLSLPFAFNPLIHFAQPACELWDFAFVGTNSELKIQETTNYLLPLVRGHGGILAGTGWPGRFLNLSQSEAALLYGFAAICPNYHLRAQIERFSEVNERTHVLAAVGAFQLVDKPAALGSLYDESELAIANSPAAYVKLFAHFRSRPQERRQMATAAMRKAWSRFSQFHVLARLLRFLDGQASSPLR